MGKLAKLAEEMSPWLRVPENTGVVVMYKGYELVDDTRNPGQQKVRYTVELNGKDKWFESASARVMLSFDTVKEGEEVMIFKSVKGGKIRYEIRPADSEDASDVEPDEA